MKKNIQEINNILAILKLVAPVREREYIRMIWAITNHVAIQSSISKEQEIQIMTDLHRFVGELNGKYPINVDATERCENHFPC
ncbi:hypothetical protein NDJ14_10625 [Vibrio alginolyticus]|uniref:hypothetical protein n=1 Tax=Vibrio alginolyticus TaxID=663 RepID=UPI00215D33A1|nr:hypothetical protein [Vibrio alginolyticus]EKL9827752.1 hypothetical protein [Vibrio alginolyticus]ELB2808031.1 hypothetical protein [Vibrio alginolyticus]ELB2846046.1 hypothetical protein [Vibrio alginolyticus]MCR9491287.1 hypothetical protein [Vibrio alginolyticus]MCS0157381.1 hypothetical protein [Vibrio alginolyticus]